MYEYERKIITTAKNYNVQERDVIFSYLVAAGITRADAFHAIYNTSNPHQTHAEADTNAAELLKNRPGLKILISKIKTRQQVNHPTTQNEVRQTIKREEEGEEESERAKKLTTRAGLTARLRSEIMDIHGKDSVQGLIQLAKLEGFDKEDTREEEEKRRYFLPYWAQCRNCALLRAYQAAQEEPEGRNT